MNNATGVISTLSQSTLNYKCWPSTFTGVSGMYQACYKQITPSDNNVIF